MSWRFDGKLRPAQGGAEGTEERVYSMVSLDVFPRQAVESNALLFSLDQPTEEDSLHGVVAALDSRPTTESGCCGSHVKRVLTNTVTFNEEQGEVLSVEKDKTSYDVWRAERRCRGDDVNMAMMARGEVPSAEEGHDVDCRRRSTSSRT